MGQITVASAQDAARRSSPELRAMREAVATAAGRERQAGAVANPTLLYGREQTARRGQTNAQDILQVEVPLEIGGQRAARRDAARLRRAAAELRLAQAASLVDFDVARAFALAVAADERARLTERTSVAFAEAQRVSDQRLAAGDVSGYAARRLRLESARYAAIRAAAMLEQRSARVALATLMGLPATQADALALPADQVTAGGGTSIDTISALDSLVVRAQRNRADVLAATLDADASEAEARLAARERRPTPTLSAGYKGERVAAASDGSLSRFSGFVAGLSLPLPIFDRRAGAVDAAAAEARRMRAEADVVRRRAAREVADAIDALRAAERQRATLAPHLGEDARLALRAVQASFAEGEITLVEWLDAVRAYQDAESTYVTLEAEVAVRRAAVVRALGASIAVTLKATR